jgi:C-terminal processing protease CtpA/Prc
MMKKINLLIISSFIFTVISCQFSNKSNFNFDLETTTKNNNLPTGWNIWGSKKYLVKTDSTTKHSSKYSVSIESTDSVQENAFGGFSYQIPAKYAGSQIELRAFIKMQNVSNGSIGLVLKIEGNSGLLGFDNMLSKNIQGTSNWTMYSVQLPLPEKAKTITIGAILAGKGKINVDDFQILIDGKDLSKAIIKEQPFIKAEADTVFNHGSGINSINLTPNQTNNLFILGKVWGFLKYYHPSIAKGEYNWDFELFRILPKVLDSKNQVDRNRVLSGWIASLGPVSKEKADPIDSSFVKLFPDIDWIANKTILGDELSNQLIQIKTAKRNTTNYYISLAENVHNPIFNENPYKQFSYPDVGFRLLSLFRYWNIIQYYFPNRKLMDQDWNSILVNYLPKFIDAKTALDYKLSTLSLIAQIQDSHANIYGYDSVLENYKGKYIVPIEIKFVENQAVVVKDYYATPNSKPTLQKGDIIKSIGEKSVTNIIKDKIPYTPASNYPTKLRTIERELFRTNDTILRVSFTRNKVAQKTLLNTFGYGKIFNGNKTDTCFKYLSLDITYLYPGTFKNSYMNNLVPLISKSKGLVIDMRCYPSDFMVFTMGNYLNSNPKYFAKFSEPSIQYPGLFTNKNQAMIGNSNWSSNTDHYKGKVIIIVNETTQSQAEYTTMAFRASRNAIVIGSTTAGADGNVSQFSLPGGITTWISGLGVYYPDGRETQRVGIIPDKLVKPTIKGIKEGRDELLEEAIKMINQK